MDGYANSPTFGQAILFRGIQNKTEKTQVRYPDFGHTGDIIPYNGHGCGLYSLLEIAIF